MFIRVDLPAPFSPRSACTSPRRRSKSTASFATMPGKRLVIFRSSRTGVSSAMRGGSYPPGRADPSYCGPETREAGTSPASRGTSRGSLLDDRRDVLDLAGLDLRLEGEDLGHDRLRHLGADLAAAR